MALIPYTANRSLKRAYADYSYPMVKRPRKTSTMPYIPRSVPRSIQPYRRSRSFSGPYRQLTNGSRHTNPVYPRPEAKLLDSTQSGSITLPPVPSPVSSTGGVVVLNDITQSVAQNGRIGNQIAMKSCSYRYEVDFGGGTAPQNGRNILIWDKQFNSTLPAVTDILSGGSYLSYLVYGNKDRFTILRNDIWSLNPNGNTTVFYEGHVRINMMTTFLDATGASIQTGALLLLSISDQTTNLPQLSGIWRMRYFDN